MAKRKNDAPKKAPTDVPLRVRRQIEMLQLSDLAAYRAWCERRGFPSHLEKSWADLEEERDAHDRERAEARKTKSLSRKPSRLLAAVCRGELAASDVDDPKLGPLCQAIEKSDSSSKAREGLEQLLATVHHKANFLFEWVTYGEQSYSYISALVALNDRRGQWVRSIEDWNPNSYNRRRQFSSLARHLMVKYQVPLFLDSVWFRRQRGSYRHRDWFFLIGNGGNIRKTKTPIPLTKKMAHQFLLAPSLYTVESALRWGQLRALGADARLCDAIAATRLGRSFEHEDFWVTVLRFFVANPMLDRAQIGPIVDYLQNQRFENQMVFTQPGVREERPPPQPNLSMRGRKPDSLLRQVERWHTELGKARRAGNLQWVSCGIGPLELVTGSREKKTQKVWRIRELLSSAELTAEGKAMRHCVATYAQSCSRGSCSIWAMEVESYHKLAKRQTVEVNRNKAIVQCRGKNNELPTQREREMLDRWAQQEGLTVSSYLDDAW